jgi:putative MFS transporter
MSDDVQPMTRSQVRVLIFLVGSTLLINNFDLSIFALALPQIQESLAIPDDRIGLYSGLVRLGVLIAFPLAFMADIAGRRTILIVTIIGLTACTLATAFVTEPAQFLALQTLARCFAYAEEMLCFVIIAEEIAAERRGWAFGRLAALGALGYGVAAALYGLVDRLPHGWRDFYLIGAAGLGLVLVARRNLKETRRFATLEAERAGQSLRAHLAPALGLVRAYPGRFWAMVGVTIPWAMGVAPALTLVSKYLQDERAFTPGQVGMLYFFGGGISVIGYFVAGRVSDLVGRKRLLAFAMPLAAACLGSIYLVPTAQWIAPAWIAGLFIYFAAEVTLSGIASELFPTSYRATAAGASAILNVLAALAGLAAQSALYGVFGTHAAAILCLVAIAPVGIVSLLLFLPETAARRLEDIAPEVESARASMS